MRYGYLLLIRFLLFNAIAACLLGVAWLRGWLGGMAEETTLLMTLTIASVFLFGMVSCTYKVWCTSMDLNRLESGNFDSNSRAGSHVAELRATSGEDGQARMEALRLKLANRVAVVRHTANTLVFLGLIGTVIGFIIALSGVNPETATDTDAVAKMVATLIQGMSVALYTTLTGAVLYIWLIVGHRMLVTGTVDLISAATRRDEDSARA